MKNTFIIILLILIAFSFGFFVNNQELKSGLSKSLEETEITETEVNTEIKPELNEYQSPFGFSFSHEKNIQLENSKIILPGGYNVSAIAAVRYVKMQHCSASGLPEHCRPFLENPAVAFGVVGESFEDLKKDKLKDVLDFAEPITLSEKEGIQFYAGVEGEGIVTIALPFKDSETLLIQYTFDELFDSAQPSADVYNSSKQKEIVDSILSSLKI